MHVTWYTAMSMDGRIASADSSLDFLDTIESDPTSQKDGGEGFEPFIASVDAVVVGASTMRWLLDRGHVLPAAGKATWVVSHDASILERIGVTPVSVQRHAGDLGSLFASIQAAGHKRIWLAGGGDVAGQALAIDRVDEVVVTIAPVVLGRGPALFDNDRLPPHRFVLTQCRRDGTAACLTWRRQRS